MDALTLRGWRPIRLYAHEQRIMVDWAMLGDAPLLEPFYQDSLSPLLRQPFHNAFRRQTTLQTLLNWHVQSPGLPADLLVFHVSRCGSTLIAQALAQSPQHLVLSEAPPVDFLVRTAREQGLLSDAQTVLALQAWLSAWAQRSDPTSPPLQAVTLKLDSWNTAQATLLSQAWPQALRTMLTREPLSVLVSQMQERAFYLVPGAMGPLFGPTGLSPLEQATLPPEQYSAHIIGRTYADMLREAQPASDLILDHAELPDAFDAQLLPRLRWQASPTERQAMRARLSQHGKRPHMTFSSDTTSKLSAASPSLRALVQQHIAPLHQALLDKRAHPLLETAV